MGEYGFSINVKGNSVQEMQRIEKSLQSLGIKASSTSDNMNKSFDRVADKLSEVGKKIAIAFSIEKLIEFGKEILNTTAEFEGFANRIKFASLNTYDASTNMAFLRAEVEKLHIPMRKAYEGFSEMQAGLVGTGIEGKRLRDLFEGVSSAAATLHLPEYSLQRTLYDLKEIGEIGINQRIVRSLSTALPGINKIVKDTFGKSFQELEKEGISGGAFLEKLGPALSKHFAGGLQQFGESLQAHLQDAQNSFTNFILDLGKKLESTFINILNGIREVFDSAPVKLFVDNIAGLVQILGTVLLTWGIYKGLVLGAAAANKIYSISLGLMQVASYTASFGVEGLIFSVEALGVAISSLGAVVAAFSLAIIIEGFIDLNKQVEDGLDKMTNFKAVAASFKSGTTAYDALRDRMGSASTKEEKGELLTDIGAQITQINTEISKTIKPSLSRSIKERGDYLKLFHSPNSWGARNQTKEITATISDFEDKLQKASAQVNNLTAMQKKLQAEGIKPFIGGPLGGGTTGRGLHGSHLSGAEGGLNQARIVNLKIDTVMRVTTSDNKNLVNHAEAAAGVIIRAANNLSESKSGTF